MRDKLCWQINQLSVIGRLRSITHNQFVYFDVPQNLSRQLFAKHNIPVQIEQEFQKAGSPYTFVFCRVKKKDTPRFFKALEELKKTMMICGYPRYTEEVNKLMDEFEEWLHITPEGGTA